MDLERLAQLADRASVQRKAGEVVVFGRRVKDASANRALAELMDCLPAPLVAPSAGSAEALEEIGRPDAEAILSSVLHRDLAYDAEVMDALAAEGLAADLLSLLPVSSRFWSNGDVGLRRNGTGWNPLSDATFDTGVIGVADGDCLVVWILDED